MYSFDYYAKTMNEAFPEHQVTLRDLSALTFRSIAELPPIGPNRGVYVILPRGTRVIHHIAGGGETLKEAVAAEVLWIFRGSRSDGTAGFIGAIVELRRTDMCTIYFEENAEVL